MIYQQNHPGNLYTNTKPRNRFRCIYVNGQSSRYADQSEFLLKVLPDFQPSGRYKPLRHRAAFYIQSIARQVRTRADNCTAEQEIPQKKKAHVVWERHKRPFMFTRGRLQHILQ